METVRRRVVMDHELAGRGGLGFCSCRFGVATSNSRSLVLEGCSTVGRELPLDGESVGRRAPEHSTARWQPLQASFGQPGRLSDKALASCGDLLGVGWTRTTRCPCWARNGLLEEGKRELWIKKGQVQLRFAPGGRVLATSEQRRDGWRMQEPHDYTIRPAARLSGVHGNGKGGFRYAPFGSSRGIRPICRPHLWYVCRFVCGCGCRVERWEYTVLVGRTRLEVWEACKYLSGDLLNERRGPAAVKARASPG